MISLLDLPPELIYQIHLLSQSSSLPLLNTYTLHLFNQQSSTTHRCEFLLNQISSSGIVIKTKENEINGSKILRFGLCDFAVLQRIEGIVEGRNKKLMIKELPKRLLKSSSSTSTLPLISYLLSSYPQININSSNGYFLARAIYSENLQLIRLLLKFGANVELNSGWSLKCAIKKGKIELIKLLLEIEPPSTTTSSTSLSTSTSSEEDLPSTTNKKKRRKSIESERGKNKKRKLNLRCKPSSELIELAIKNQFWNIVDYLTELGGIPNLKSLLSL